MDLNSFRKSFEKVIVNENNNSVPKTPKVSICIQTYQHVNYIKQCLDGVLQQKTNFPIEILLGEDASTDGTREICIQYAKENPQKIRLFLHHRENNISIDGNPTGRFNFVYNLLHARGKYIALCEGDDYWTDPLKLQKQVDFLEAHPGYVGCFHNTDMINEMEMHPTLKPWRNFDKQKFVLEDTIATRALFHTSSFVFKREALLLPNWFTEVQSGDMALFSIIASQGLMFRINETMSVYRKNETGITNNISTDKYHSGRIKLFKYISSFLNNEIKEKTNTVISFHKKQLNKKKKNQSLFSKVITKIKKNLVISFL